MEDTFDKKPFTVSLSLLITIISSTIMLTFVIVSFYFESKIEQSEEVTATRQEVSQVKQQIEIVSTTLTNVVNNQNDMKSKFNYRFKIDSTQIQGLVEDVHELKYYAQRNQGSLNSQKGYSYNDK
jgi:flagellar basal body-associated protein FliL